MSDTTELLGLAIDSNPIDFASKFDELLRSKTIDALESKKFELAQSMYAAEPEETDDFSDDDFDLDNDDFDLDLEDDSDYDNGDTDEQDD
jgi:hypothetical protein